MPNGVVLPLAPALLYMHLDVLLRFFSLLLSLRLRLIALSIVSDLQSSQLTTSY